MPATLHDIAKAAGKSYSTVSRALSGSAEISDRTRETILQIATRLGYRPSFVGQALKQGRTRILAVIIPDLSDPFYAEFVRNFRLDASEHGYETAIYDYALDPKLELRHLERMLAGCCDGVVAFITSLEHTGQVVEQYWNARIPLVAVGTPDSSEVKFDQATVDFRGVTGPVFQKLVETGKHHLAFIQEGMARNTLARVKGLILERFQDIPLKFDPKNDMYCVPSSSLSQAQDGYEVGKRIFARRPDTDVILVWHGVQAYGVIRAALEAGKKIPSDLALIVCDHTWVSQFALFPVISIDQRLDRLASAVWEMLQARLDGHEWNEEPQRRLVMSEVCF